jgi:CheY-like chemotaxis protein
MAKVLLVEDDNNLREIFDMRLQAEGYKTVTAGDGEEALVVAVKEKPDLVIADVMMPKLSGFEMVENMRAAPEMANVKVIMMTALGQAEDRARGEKLGVVKYLVKSQVTLEDFVRIVREVMSPDGSAGAAPAQTNDAAQTDPAAPTSSMDQTNINQEVESEKPMQDDNQTPANPAPDAANPVPANDNSAPSSDAAAGANPISGSPVAPLGDTATNSDAQQSTAEETSEVQDQINNFETDPAAGAGINPSVNANNPAPAVDENAPALGQEPAAPAGDAPGANPVNDAPAMPADPNAPAAGQAPEGENPVPPASSAL